MKYSMDRNMNRRIVAFVVLMFVTLLGMSHEFWLQPKKYRYKVGEQLNVDFMVGQGFIGEFWDLKRHRVEKLMLYNVSGEKDLLNEVKLTKGNNLTYKFLQQGTHVLAMQSNDAYIELEADKFNSYLKEDGLDNILDERKKSDDLNNRSKEYYTRFAKVIFQSGDKTDDTYKKPVGSRLEIILENNPYALKVGDYLQCKVLYEGKPSAHTLVKVWSHIGEKIFLQNSYTENDGTLKFPISNKGSWMVSCVRMNHSEKDITTYHSLWSSLVFGIE